MTYLPFAYLMRGQEEFAGLSPQGLQVPLFATDDRKFWSHTDDFGNVDRFDLTPPLPSEQLTFVPFKHVQHIGAPRLCALIAHPDKPDALEVLPWQEMAKRVLTDFSRLLPFIRQRPVAGYRLADFMCEDVLRYVAANRLGPELGQGKYPFEYSVMQQIRDIHLRASRGQNPKPNQDGYLPGMGD